MLRPQPPSQTGQIWSPKALDLRIDSTPPTKLFNQHSIQASIHSELHITPDPSI